MNDPITRRDALKGLGMAVAGGALLARSGGASHAAPAAAASANSPGGTPAKRPNIVLVTCHDLGQHIGCYGIPTVHTETLDSIAANGVRFSRSFATSTGCSPSRSSLATGRYPHSNGVLGLTHGYYEWDLHTNERHMARQLGNAGYFPALFGFQHVTSRPEAMGFRKIFPRHEGATVAKNLQEFLAGDRPDQPLYIEINFMEPHRPFSMGGAKPDDSLGVTVPPYLKRNEASVAEFAEIQGAIRKTDENVRGVWNALKEANLLDDTMFIFTTDHGIAFPRAKGTLYDPGIETALIIAWPGGGAVGGRVEDAMISGVDLLPTLLDVAGAPTPHDVQGRSFLHLLSGKPYERRDAIFVEKTFHDKYNPMRAIRTERYKFIARMEVNSAVEVPGEIMTGATFKSMVNDTIRPAGQRFELYDLEADPVERVNLSGKPEVAEIERTLRRRLLAWMEETDDPLLKGPVASPFYYETMRQLRAD